MIWFLGIVQCGLLDGALQTLIQGPKHWVLKDLVNDTSVSRGKITQQLRVVVEQFTET